MARITPITLMLAATTLLLVAGGCEKRVVNQHFGPMTGLHGGTDYTQPLSVTSPVQTAPRKQKNFLEKAWDGMDQLLFGWAKNDKPTTTQPPPQNSPVWFWNAAEE